MLLLLSSLLLSLLTGDEMREHRKGGMGELLLDEMRDGQKLRHLMRTSN